MRVLAVVDHLDDDDPFQCIVKHLLVVKVSGHCRLAV